MVEVSDRVACVPFGAQLVLRTFERNEVGDQGEEERGEYARGHQVEILFSNKLERDFMEYANRNSKQSKQISNVWNPASNQLLAIVCNTYRLVQFTIHSVTLH